MTMCPLSGERFRFFLIFAFYIYIEISSATMRGRSNVWISDGAQTCSCTFIEPGDQPSYSGAVSCGLMPPTLSFSSAVKRVTRGTGRTIRASGITAMLLLLGGIESNPGPAVPRSSRSAKRRHELQKVTVVKSFLQSFIKNK